MGRLWSRQLIRNTMPVLAVVEDEIRDTDTQEPSLRGATVVFYQVHDEGVPES